jgi:uncharacterized repeat protein (TIGR01451 family)
MKNIFLLLLISVNFSLFSQSNKKKTLSANQVSALFNSNGILFQNQSALVAGYEIPKGTGLNTFFSASIWIAGKDENDTLRVAALRYGQGRDFFPGPYTLTPNLNQNLDYLYQWEKQIWKVSKEQIACHIANINNPNYVIPEDILTWPGNGDITLGISNNLAPFVDLNGDNIYSPENGEYPLIKGDEAVFYIMNDIAGPHTETGGLPLGIEAHVMAYQFKETNSYLDSTTFINYKIINKGTHTVDSLHVAFYMDADVGNYADDYVGCDVSRGMLYFYNGDLYDESDGGRPGYLEFPPAAGVLSLSDNMKYSGYYTSLSPYPYNDPGPAAQYYNFMTGKWADGSPRYYGGLGYQGSTGVSNELSNYMFPGISDQNGTLSTNGIDMSQQFPNGWSESTSNNPPMDRRGYLANEPFPLNPGQTHCVDFAFLFARSSDAGLMSSVNRLGLVSDSCRQFYNGNLQASSCLETVTSDLTSYPACTTTFLPPSLGYNGPKIRRIDGYGNGNNELELTQASIDSIITNGFMPIVEYENGKGPIHVEIVDSNAYLPGYYRCELIDYTPPTIGNGADTARWVIHRSYNSQITSYYGDYNISVDTFKIIPELGLKIKIHQKKYVFPSGSGNIAAKSTEMINAKLEFSGASEWLTGVRDNDGFFPTNWIRSGDYAPETDPANVAYECQPNGSSYLDPCSYRDEIGADPNEDFEDILNGIVAPHRLTGYQADYMPISYYNMSIPGNSKTTASISFLPSVDIVITSDQSKWTRCPVIELGRNTTTNIGNAAPGGLRQSPSVNKNGTPDGTGTGMGWFPGYAIDLESGARLYMTFGENSSLAANNGADMKWNPTSEILDGSGNPILGGQHPIYIFSYKQKTINGFTAGFDFPAYDPSVAETNSGNLARIKIQEVMTNNATSKREFYGSMSWIINPLLKTGHTLFENDVKMKLSINKEYKNFSASGGSSGPPTYDWNNGQILKLEAYRDINADCIKNDNEIPLASMNAELSPIGLSLTSDSFGYFIVDSLPDGNYTLNVDTTNLTWTPSCGNSISFTISNGVLSGNTRIGFVNSNPCPAPEVSVYAPTLRRCFPNQRVYVSACNDVLATAALSSSYVDVELDPLMTFDSSSISGQALGNNTYRFQTGDLQPNQCFNFNISTTISCDAISEQTLCVRSTLLPIDTCYLDNIPSVPITTDGIGNQIDGLPAPCSLPYDGSHLVVDGWCDNDSIRFKIDNSGPGDMQCFAPVWLTVDSLVYFADSVKILSGQSQTYSFPANGKTWILNVEQHPLHPGNSHPNAFVEACGDLTNWTPALVNIFPQDDADPMVDIYCGIVTGSYDPNDKTGFPLGVTDQNFIRAYQQLQYVIRFQNTGNDTAFTVVIRDTLDVDLNLFTVTTGVSSHPYEFRIYGPRVLEWRFNNINLPDSTTDLVGSNGFVTFHVDPVPNLAVGSEITNDADIYFDYNDPIITNTTIHRIYEGFVGLDEGKNNISSTVNLLVYPNPTLNSITIQGEKWIENAYKVFDQMGREVNSGKLNGIKTEVSLSHLSKGIYILRVEGDFAPIKIIKE